MPIDTLPAKLAGMFRYVPFKCRACRAKFYRRPRKAPDRPQPVGKSAPVRNVAVRQRDLAITLQRLEKIIRVAEGRHLQRG